MALSDLADRLEEERAAIEELCFVLEQQQLLLAAGRVRWLPRQTATVQAVSEALAVVSARRARAAGIVAGALGLPESAPLEEIVARAPEGPERTRLAEIHHTLTALADQLAAAVTENRTLLARGLSATNDALALLGTSSGYDATGTLALHGLPSSAAIDARV
jgi:flagellar biosynthesis/type III secretory pathway chaperone